MTDPADAERPTVDARRATELADTPPEPTTSPSRSQFRRARATRHLRRRRRLAAFMIVIGLLLIAAAVWRWWTLTDEAALALAQLVAIR